MFILYILISHRFSSLFLTCDVHCSAFIQYGGDWRPIWARFGPEPEPMRSGPNPIQY